MTATPPVDPSTLPSLPRFTDYTTCTAPTRKIYTEADLPHWLESEAYHYIELMILRLSVAVDNKTVQDTCQDNDVGRACFFRPNCSLIMAVGRTQASRRLVDFLKRAEGWIDEIPLQTGPQRFGNKAFRDWMAKLEQVGGTARMSRDCSSADLYLHSTTMNSSASYFVTSKCPFCRNCRTIS